MRTPRRRRLFAAFGAFVMLFTFATATVLADSPNPNSIQATVNGNTLTLTGTWNWDRNACDAVNDRYVGWAVDWDDPNAPGHLVPGTKNSGASYLVGTPNDNTVHTNGDCGAPGGPGVQGTWGPISHTYSGPGQYEVCVVTYDIHRGDEGKPGGHGLIAGGPDRNKDNSVEKNAFTPNQGGVDCAPLTIVIDDTVTAQKTVDKATANPGDTLNYTITVTGGTKAAVNNVTVTDDISALLARGTLTGSNPAATVNGNVLSWSGQNFAIGQVRTYTFSVQLDSAGWPNGTTTLPNTVVVTKSNCPPGSPDPKCNTTTTVTPNPAITVTKTPDAQSVVVGNQVGFTITVTSTGQSTATNVQLSDALPTLAGIGVNWTISPAYGGPGTCGINGAPPTETLVCSFGNMAPGATASIHVVSNTSAPAQGQTVAACQTTIVNWATNLNNQVQVTSSNATSATAQTGVCVTGSPHISVTKTPDAQSVVAGNPVGFTITVTSDGVGTATNVNLSDALPTLAGIGINWAISPAYGGPGTCGINGAPPNETLNCNFGNMASGTSASVHVTSATTAPVGGAAIAACQTTVTNFATNLNNAVQVTSSNAGSATAQTGTCVTGNPHITVTKAPDAQSVVAGNSVGFTITVTSDGIGTATNVQLSDALPTLTGLGINWSISPAYGGPGTCGINGAPPTETLVCNFGDLASGASASVHVVSNTTAPTGGQTIAACQVSVTNFATNLNNSVQITSSNATGATAQTGTCVTGTPHISLVKTPDAQTVVAGNQIGFTITVTNDGIGAVNNVQITDSLPQNAAIGIQWSESPDNADCAIATGANTQTLSCNFGTLAQGASRSVHIVSNTTAPVGGAAIAPCQISVVNYATNVNNTAQATSSANGATAITGICVTNVPHISVTKTPDAQSVVAGNPVGFTITVTSDGVGTATNVNLSDALPTLAGIGINWSISPAVAGCAITGAVPGQTLACAFGDLAAGQVRSVHVTSATTAPTGGQTIAACQTTVTNFATNLNNAVQVTSTSAGSATAQTGTCVTGNPALTVVKTPDAQTVVAGSNVGFTITVTSSGTGTATNVVLTDPLPTLPGLGINWVISPAVAGCAITGAVPSQTLGCSFGDLPAGASRSVHVTSPTTAPTGGQTIAACQTTVTNFATNLNNAVQVTSTSATSAIAQTGTCVTSNPHLSVTKIPDAANVLAGNAAGFTITVTSDGVGTATAVVLTDNLPGNAALGVNWTISPAVAGCSISGAAPTQTLSCNFGDLPAGQSRSVHVTSPTTAPTGGTTIAACVVSVVSWATNLNNSVTVTSQTGGSATAVTGICVSQNEQPAIRVVKVANPTALPAGGGPVTYTFSVTNVGNVPLTNVTVVDDKCSPVTFVGGDANGNSTLEVSETWTYTCSQTITVTTTNTVLATGFRNSTPVTDTDTATVTVPTPTPSPTGSVQIATSPPKVTLPPTDASPTGQDGGTGSGTAMLLVLLAGIAVAAPLLAVGRRRNQVR